MLHSERLKQASVFYLQASNKEKKKEGEGSSGNTHLEGSHQLLPISAEAVCAWGLCPQPTISLQAVGRESSWSHYYTGHACDLVWFGLI